jgi:hypothetical protein
VLSKTIAEGRMRGTAVAGIPCARTCSADGKNRGTSRVNKTL